MPIDSTFTTNTEIRLIKLELGMTDLLKLLRNGVSKEQFNRINVSIQKQIDLLDTRLTSLETETIRLDTLYDDLL